MAGKIIHKKKTNLSADKAGQRTEPITKECCGETEQGGKQRAGRPMTKENESYEDPDQTPLSGKEADMQIDLWSCLSKMSAPYSETMCPWARTLTRGDYARMERLLEGIEAEALTHLLEKRESNERISAIVHVILGASATFRSHPSFYKVTKFFEGAERQHLACLKKLLQLGAKIQVHDIAGSTPLHYCIQFGSNETTMQMARLLLEHGADPNAKDRRGLVPLAFCVIHKDVNFIKLLCEFGADPEIPTTDGVTPQMLAHAHDLLEIETLIAEEARKFCWKQRLKAKEAGDLKVCQVCRVSRHCKRCAGCCLVWYCGVACQRLDWARHRAHCQQAQAQFMPVRVKGTKVTSTPRSMTAFFLVDNVKNEKMDSGQPTKSHFVVKVQVSLSGELTVNNEEKSINGLICLKQNPDIFPILEKKIRAEGRHGNVGFFYAMWKQELRINPRVVLPVEVW